jgi:PAS domain S-box-containing protein
VELHHPDGRVGEITAIGGVPLYVVTGICQDADGGVWITSGSSFAGAYRWDGARWDHFDVGGKDVYIHKIRRDRRGRLWFLGIGVYSGMVSTGEPGAFVLDGGSFIPWGTRQGLMSGRVYAFAEGMNGSLWFGTMAGISRWSPSAASGGTWKHWTSREGLRGHRVFTMAVDSAGTVWFGDYDGRQGLGYVDTSDAIHYLTTADGLANDQVWDVKADRAGILWITTSGGLSSLDHGIFSTFDDKSGLPHLSLWPVLPLDRHIYVGTTGRGVAILDRGESTTPTPVIELEPPLIEHNAVLLRWKALAHWGELSPHDIFTRYRLSGGPWSAWEKTTEVKLDDLPAGDYAYQVEAKGLFGNFDVGGSRGTFTVPLPLQLRPLFVVPVALLMLVIVVLTVILLLRKRKHDREIRRSEEKFRTVAEMTSSAILIYQEDRLVFVNSGAAALTGYSEDELLAMHLRQLIHPDHWEFVRKRELDSRGDTSLPQRYECKIVGKFGDERWIDFSSGWITFQGMPVRLGTAMDITDRKKAEDKLRSLASELSLTEERERRRMASYLHDVIGQTLALCKIKVRALQKAPTAEGLEAPLVDLRGLIEQSIHNTQSLTFELCPPILYELSLEAAVEWLGERMHEQSGLAIVIEDDKQPKPLSSDMRAVLFQAVREILVNIIKHAQATLVNVRLSRSDGTFHIAIRDDGVGFDVSRKGETKSGGGFGLFNIRERLSYLGGQLEIESRPGAGTNVSIIAPLGAEHGPPGAP